jgi:uncharacterized protein (TIGR02996 family)
MPTTSGDGAALLRAICDNPEEDTPRLVYADWLEEQGGESNIARAQFIRLQIAEAAKDVYNTHGRALTPDELAVARPHWKTWSDEQPKYAGLLIHVGDHCRFYERGFPYFLHTNSVRSFLKAAPELFTRVPITRLHIGAITVKTAGELARSPFLARIRELFQPSDWDDTILPEFASTPHLCNLQTITLGDQRVTLAGLRRFLANKSLTRLREFTLHDCPYIGPGVVQQFTACASAAVLERIGLEYAGLGPAAAPDLPALVRLPMLKYLRLNSNGLGYEAAVSLAGVSVAAEALIDLQKNEFTDRGGEALLNGEFLRSPRLRVHLRGNSFSDAMRTKLKEAFLDRVTV